MKTIAKAQDVTKAKVLFFVLVVILTVTLELIF